MLPGSTKPFPCAAINGFFAQMRKVERDCNHNIGLTDCRPPGNGMKENKKISICTDAKSKLFFCICANTIQQKNVRKQRVKVRSGDRTS